MTVRHLIVITLLPIMAPSYKNLHNTFGAQLPVSQLSCNLFYGMNSKIFVKMKQNYTVL